MRKYIVVYEPSNPNFRDPAYAALAAELQKMGRVLCACAWIVESPLPAGDLCNSLHAEPFMANDDRIVVSEIGPNSAAKNTTLSV